MRRHDLIVDGREHFEAVKDKASDRYGFSSPVGYFRPTKRLLVDIFVSVDELDYALDTANQLFVALEACGYAIGLAHRDRSYQRPGLDERLEPIRERRFFYRSWDPARPTVVLIGTVAVGLTVFELSEHLETRFEDHSPGSCATGTASRASGTPVRIEARSAERSALPACFLAVSRHELGEAVA